MSGHALVRRTPRWYELVWLLPCGCSSISVHRWTSELLLVLIARMLALIMSLVVAVG